MTAVSTLGYAAIRLDRRIHPTPPAPGKAGRPAPARPELARPWPTSGTGRVARTPVGVARQAGTDRKDGGKS
nr:hypothetical protein GCM10020092_080290 [Actinoplanes digitatis]